MKKYLKEIIIVLIQTLIFYLLPVMTKMIDPLALVLTLLLYTFILSIIMGIISNKKLKYIYPVITVVIFIPSIFIYYNESALVHCLWYFIISTIGVIAGNTFYKLLKLK